MRNKFWVNETNNGAYVSTKGRQRNHPDAIIQCVSMWEKQETEPGRADGQEEEHLFQGQTRIKCNEEADMQSGLQICSGLSRSRDGEAQGGPWQEDKVDKTRSASPPGLDGLTYGAYKSCPMALKLLWNLMTVTCKTQGIPSEWTESCDNVHPIRKKIPIKPNNSEEVPYWMWSEGLSPQWWWDQWPTISYDAFLQYLVSTSQRGLWRFVGFSTRCHR